MKHFISALLFSIICLCAESQVKKAIKPAAGSSWTVFKKILPGTWVKTSYLETLARTKSPRQSQGTGGDRVVYVIDPSMIKATVVEADGQTLHEGGYGFKIFRKPGSRPGSFLSDIQENEFSDVSYGDASFVFRGKDTSMVFNLYNKAKKLLGSTTYIKSSCKGEDATACKVNETLFSGGYQTSNMAGATVHLQFNDNGTVSGFDNFTSYYINSFFLEDGDADEVIFKNKAGVKQYFVWEIKDNTILLYAEEKVKQYGFKKGALQYTLVKNQ